MAVYRFIVVPPNLDADEHDFFEYNPELQYIDPVPRLIKDVGPMVASRVMWAVYLSEDPQSKFFSMREEERRYQISKNFLKNVDFGWDLYGYMIDAYPDISMSKKKARFQRLDKKFDQMLNEMEGDNLKEAVTFYSKLDAMYRGLKKAEEAYEEEMAEALVETRGQQQSGFFGSKKSEA